MFGEYAQVASYMQPARAAAYQSDALHKELPSYLSPIFHPPQPWDHGRTKSGLGEDFIMIAEFSELEGPKPLMTIPKDGGANFDQNSFAVRILAVDHHNPTDGFSISEDTQIVLTDSEAGVFAFVHHLVLYDNTARGFVRPYCIAFITAEQRKLMYFYEELSWKFKKVARFLKYGNKMVFVGDLERHLKDLEHTKNVLLNQVCKIRLRSSDGPEDQITDARKNAENELYRGLKTIQQSSSEIKDILSVLKPLLPDRRLEARFRILEDRAYQGYSTVGLDKLSLPESSFTDFFSNVDELDFRYGSLTEPRISPLALYKPREYKPVLVETKKAKRFNAPLRGMHELCSWGAKEGLRKLRFIHMYFKRDMAVLELHKNESRLFRPRCTSIYHGQCVTGNFLSGVQMKKSLDATEEAELNWSMLYSNQWSSLGSLASEDSFKSADSFPSGNDHIDASPSSFHTYDSQSCNIFQSASASPEKEFSLLMSNEYYPDLKTSHGEGMTYTESLVLHDFCQNEKTVVTDDVDRIFMATNGEFSQRHIRSSSWNENSFSEKVNFCDTNMKISSQAGSRAVLNEINVLQKDGMSGSDYVSSCMILDMKVREMNDNFINNESMVENEKSKFYCKSKVLNMNVEYLLKNDDELTYKIKSFNTESGNGMLHGHGECINDCFADVTIQNRNDFSISADKDMVTHNGQDGRSVNGSGLALSEVPCYSVASVDDNMDKSVSLNSAQSLSENLQCPYESIFTLEGHADDHGGGNKKQLLPRNLKPASEDGFSSAEGNPHLTTSQSPHCNSQSQHCNSQSQHCNSSLSVKLEQEQTLPRIDKVTTLPMSSLQVNEFLKNGSEIPLQNGSEIPSQNGSENPPQNGSNNCQIDSKNSNRNNFPSVSQNGSEKNCRMDSEIPLKSDAENNQNLSEVPQNDHDIFQNGSEMSMNGSEKSQNATEKSENVFEIPQNDSGISQDPETSSQKPPTDSLSNDKPENKSPSETNGEQGTHGYKGKTTSSKLSHSLLTDYCHFEHHITRVTHLRGEKSIHPGLHVDDALTRARTESDVSSVFTEISIQDLFPHLNSTENDSKDGALYEGCQAATLNEQSDIPTSQNMTLWKPRCGAYTVGDWINNLSQARPGFGLSEVLLTYQCLDHVIFSLLCGRPVLVAGSAKMESEIIRIVNALAVFVPMVRRKSQAVLEWTSKPLKMTDLIKLKLIGVCRPERRSLDSFVPSAIKKACTVVDIEKRTIVAPPYQGQFIPALMSKKNILRSDVQLLAYIEWWLMGILAKAFIFFHSFCLGSSGSVLYSQSPKDQRDAYHVIVSGIMDRLGVKECDCDIVENLTEMVKLTKMESGFWQGVDSGCVVYPLTLQHMTCDKFRC